MALSLPAEFTSSAVDDQRRAYRLSLRDFAQFSI